VRGLKGMSEGSNEGCFAFGEFTGGHLWVMRLRCFEDRVVRDFGQRMILVT
jgi:hypothetical protein